MYPCCCGERRRRGNLAQVIVVLLAGALAYPALAGAKVASLADTILDEDALLYSSSATYGRAINGLSFQTEALLTVGEYQYATWYHLGSSDEDVYLARRTLTGGAWEVMDTGMDLTRTTSDAHNVISMGISGDGVIHLSWDHHNHTLNYMNSIAGAASGATWDASIFNAARSSLNAGGSSVYDVTYPRFITDATTGDMYMSFRTGYSGNGDMNLTRYHADTGMWDTPHQIINGTSIDVNPYLNCVDVDGNGRIHITWTWRASASGTNYNIMYVYSDNGGATWRNGAGASLGTIVYSTSPGILIDDDDSGNGVLGGVSINSSLMNQQTQAVDLQGRVHVVMWHADDAHRDLVSGFNTTVSQYYHYWRDPASGVWTRTELPTEHGVGSRPDLAYDATGNLYVVYVPPGSGGYYTNGNVVIATATSAADYTDWENAYTDTRVFVGEPRLDQQRLLDDGTLSVFVQENTSVTSLTSTPLHVLDLSVGSILFWAGDDLGVWDHGAGLDWDTDGDDIGDAAFTAEKSVRFDDGATTFNVAIATPVQPLSVDFINTTNAYTLSGSSISGDATLRVNGGGVVTLANGANTYAGETSIEDGTLALSGAAAIVLSPTIEVAAAGTFDVSAVDGGAYTLFGQTLTIDGELIGDIVASSGASVHVNSSNSLDGDLTLEAGALVDGVGRVTGNLDAVGGTVRVGGAGLSFNPSGFVVDDFESYALGNVRDVASPPWTAHRSDADADIEDDGTGNRVLTFGDSNYAGASRDMPVDGVIDDTEVATFFFRFNSKIDNPDYNFGLADQATTTAENFGDFEAQVRLTDDSGASGTFLLDARDGGGFSAVLASGLAVDRWYNVWMVVDQTTDTYDVYLNTGTANATVGDKLNSSPLHFRNGTTDPLNKILGIGVASVTDAVRYDDLAYLDGVNLTNPLGGLGEGLNGSSATLTIDGDVSLEANATLELDVVDVGIVDRLSVGGELVTGGTLDLVFDPDGATPKVGDVYDLLEATSYSGAFDVINAGALGAGEIWDMRALYSTGEIAVASAADLLDESLDCFSGPDNTIAGNCQAQDHDGDNDEDLHDFAKWQACATNASGMLFADCLEQ